MSENTVPVTKSLHEHALSLTARKQWLSNDYSSFFFLAFYTKATKQKKIFSLLSLFPLFHSSLKRFFCYSLQTVLIFTPPSLHEASYINKLLKSHCVFTYNTRLLRSSLVSMVTAQPSVSKSALPVQWAVQTCSALPGLPQGHAANHSSR